MRTTLLKIIPTYSYVHKIQLSLADWQCQTEETKHSLSNSSVILMNKGKKIYKVQE